MVLLLLLLLLLLMRSTALAEEVGKDLKNDPACEDLLLLLLFPVDHHFRSSFVLLCIAHRFLLAN